MVETVNIRTTDSGIVETVEIPADDFRQEMRAVRAHGGTVLRSAPVTRNGAPAYRMTVEYA